MDHNVFGARRTFRFVGDLHTSYGCVDFVLAIRATEPYAKATQIGGNSDSDSKHFRFLSGKGYKVI